MGLMLLKGNERPAEIISLAYRMEQGLGQFYASGAGTADDPDVSALLAHLADIEMKHKDRLFGLYQSLVDIPVDRENFEADMVSNVVEGGFSVDEFEAQNRFALQTTADTLSLAMMLEAQAMDLYMRYADERVDSEGQKILFQIANEEKAHLNSLAALLEQKV